MINIELIFDIANCFFLAGTTLLIYAIVLNRNVLKGFQPAGSLLTLFAMLFIEFNYLQMSLWKSFLFSIPTIALWVLASTYSIKNSIPFWKMKFKHWKRKRWRIKVLKKFARKRK